jgi:hypothetical protein
MDSCRASCGWPGSGAIALAGSPFRKSPRHAVLPLALHVNLIRFAQSSQSGALLGSKGDDNRSAFVLGRIQLGGGNLHSEERQFLGGENIRVTSGASKLSAEGGQRRSRRAV